MKKNGKRRVWVLLVLCAVVFAVFLARLVWMQFIMADHYAEKVRDAAGGPGGYHRPQRHGSGAGYHGV